MRCSAACHCFAHKARWLFNSLARDDVVGLLLADLLDDLALASHRVDRDAGAAYVQQSEQLRDGDDLVALVGRLDLPQHHARRTAPRRDQMSHRFDAVARAAQALAIDVDRMASQRRAQTFHPGDEASLEPLGIDQRSCYLQLLSPERW